MNNKLGSVLKDPESHGTGGCLFRGVGGGCTVTGQTPVQASGVLVPITEYLNVLQSHFSSLGLYILISTGGLHQIKLFSDLRTWDPKRY